MRPYFAVLFISLLTGCAGQLTYTAPNNITRVSINTKTINRPVDSVWKASIPQLSKQFFVINNLDKSSGFMNISYSGDPEQFIDCGRIKSFVKNARGERTYDFPAARAQESYEILNPNIGLFFVNRTMSLEGRANVVFEAINEDSTRVTVNTRYLVTRKQTIQNAARSRQQTTSSTIEFNTNQGASFPPNAQGEATRCVATGMLESQVLSEIQ